MSKTRCKMTCLLYGPQTEGSEEMRAHFIPVTTGSPENESFFKFTPGGSLELSVINPDIKFEVGKDYYIDIIPADNSADAAEGPGEAGS